MPPGFFSTYGCLFFFAVILSLGRSWGQLAPRYPVSRAGPEQVSNGNRGDNPSTSERVILIYTLDGCRRFSSESASDVSGHVELQSPKRARELALSELEKRVNRVLQQNLGMSSVVSALFRRTLGEESIVSDDVPDQQSIRLQSRYLHALQIEVTDVPPKISKRTMANISDDLPCVDMVFEDERKVMTSRLVAKTAGLGTTENGNTNALEGFDEIETIQGPSLGSFNSSAASVRRNLQGTYSVKPNDQFYKEQWHLSHDDWGLGLRDTWKTWTGDPSMVVAIIDSGCDLKHPDIEVKKWTNSGEVCGDGIDNDKNGYIDDCHGWDWVDNDSDPSPAESGHGTAAAGIIAATTNNRIGIAGVCWQCRIMCLRFIDGVEGNVSDQVSAIDYAAKMGARISNNSYGGYGSSKLEYEVIRRARSYGHLFVSSAGNNNYDTDLPQHDHTPSSYSLDNILAVGASTSSGVKASFSNYGSKSVDFFAPGSRIVTTEMRGGYAIVSGTSFAAPMGAGAAALVWSRYPILSHVEIIRILSSSCNKNESLRNLAVCGGVIDVQAAMNMAESVATAKEKAGGMFPTGKYAPAVPKPAPITNGGGTTSNSGRHSPLTGNPTDSGAPASPAAGLLSAFLSGFTRAFSRTNDQPDDDSTESEEIVEGLSRLTNRGVGAVQWIDPRVRQSIEAVAKLASMESKPAVRSESSRATGSEATSGSEASNNVGVNRQQGPSVDSSQLKPSGKPLINMLSFETRSHQVAKPLIGSGDLIQLIRASGILGSEGLPTNGGALPTAATTPQAPFSTGVSSRQWSSNGKAGNGVEKVINSIVNYPAFGQQLQWVGPALKTALGLGSSARSLQVSNHR